MLTAQSLERLLSQPTVPPDVQEEASTLLAGEFAESIDFIHNAVRHLGTIIDGLLRLSRVGRIEYEDKPVDMNALVKDILAAMHGQIAAAGAVVHVGELPAVRGDRNALGQVFANIVGNALKSFGNHTERVIEIAASDDTPPVFSIRDTGIGIPAEYQPKIFQVFQRVHQTGTRGEGMGLAIVRRIVERHGGRIWFESSPGSGTTFFFTIGNMGDQ
jgi:signal transduction histidine kinase